MRRIPRKADRYEREILVSAIVLNHTIMLAVINIGQRRMRIKNNSPPTPACHKLVTRDGINNREMALGKFVRIFKNAIPTF